MKQDSLAPLEPDQVFAALALSGSTASPVIACFYTGGLPPCCAPMPRDPAPPVGQAIDARFAVALVEATRLNPAVHDGAIMVGRDGPEAPYLVSGWSYRLFPPEVRVSMTANRGSAFHSSLAMSRVTGVDRVYLVSRGAVFRFAGGRRLPLE
jgi:hypothetical protein